MLCISLWNPWAHLLVHGKKLVETRGWELRHRGPLLVHAARKWDGELAALTKTEPFCSVLRSLGVMWSDTGKPSLPFGAMVGCYPTEKVALMDFAQGEPVNLDKYGPRDASHPLVGIAGNERAFGDYSAGRFAWLCANPVAFQTPIPFAGRQGLFEVPDHVLARGSGTPPPAPAARKSRPTLFDAEES